MNFDSLRFLMTGGHKKQIIEIYELLRPQSFNGLRKIRVGNREADGGYVMADDFEKITAVLSLGIGAEVSWDIEIADRGIEVFQFDHTVDAPNEVAGNPRLHFHKMGIAGKTDPTARMKSLPDVLSEELSEHTGDLILKIDIDGYEWEVFTDMPNEVLQRFRQICIEIHNPLARPGQRGRRLRNLAVLRKLSRYFRPVHLHANNAGPVRSICGLELPKLLEICYLRDDGQDFTDSKEILPGEFDVPNVPGTPEINVGRIFECGGAI